jgi:hypothetical protein
MIENLPQVVGKLSGLVKELMEGEAKNGGGFNGEQEVLY